MAYHVLVFERLLASFSSFSQPPWAIDLSEEQESKKISLKVNCNDKKYLVEAELEPKGVLHDTLPLPVACLIRGNEVLYFSLLNYCKLCFY